MQVEVYRTNNNGEQELLGTLNYTGGKISPSSNNPALQNLLKQPVYVDGKYVTAEDDPYEFLANMSSQYSGSYLRVSGIK